MTDRVGQAIAQTKLSKSGASIRRRLLVLAIVAIVPLALERIYTIESERRSDIEDARHHALILAQQGAEKQNESIAAARVTLQLIARAYPKFIESKVPCDEFLKAAFTNTPSLKTISVVGPDGKIVCSANPGSIGLDISDRPFFQQILRNGGFAMSDYLLGRRILGPIIVVGYGERSPSGSVDVVFNAVLDLDWIGRIAADVARRAGSDVLMVDGTGTVLTRYPNLEKWVGRQFPDVPLIKTALAQTEGVISTQGIDGVARIFAFTQLSGTSARFIVGLNEREALQKVNAAMVWSYGQLTIVAAIVLIGIWFGGERFFMRPILALAQTATDIGHGRLTARAARDSLAAEFVPLATAMDKMADELALREAQLHETNEKLEILAQRDGLTGLANRRLFDARLLTAWQVSAALKSPLALLMIDIDHFKLFNDKYGHLEGDTCLRMISDVLKASARNDGDLAARYGGEEFIVMLPGANIDDAEKVAERLRKAVEELNIANADAPLGHLTISIGVASSVDGGGGSAEDLVRAADSALYVAKFHGRNKVATGVQINLSVTG